MPRLRFLLSVSELIYIRDLSVIIAKHAVRFIVQDTNRPNHAEPYGTAYPRKRCSDRKAPTAPCPEDPARKVTSLQIKQDSRINQEGVLKINLIIYIYSVNNIRQLCQFVMYT